MRHAYDSRSWIMINPPLAARSTVIAWFYIWNMKWFLHYLSYKCCMNYRKSKWYDFLHSNDTLYFIYLLKLNIEYCDDYHNYLQRKRTWLFSVSKKFDAIFSWRNKLKSSIFSLIHTPFHIHQNQIEETSFIFRMLILYYVLDIYKYSLRGCWKFFKKIITCWNSLNKIDIVAETWTNTVE